MLATILTAAYYISRYLDIYICNIRNRYIYNSMCKQDKCTNLNISPQELIPASELMLTLPVQ